MTGPIASKLTMNLQRTHWVSDPSPPVLPGDVVFHVSILHLFSLSHDTLFVRGVPELTSDYVLEE